MRLITASMLVLAAAAPVAAQPATPTTCAVTIARAPDDVRQVVEAWVAAERRCSTALEVRIVATEGGYYLLARDEHGRVRERIVPDAQSAGVLVASWVADDAMPAPAAPSMPAPPAAPMAPAPVAPAPVAAAPVAPVASAPVAPVPAALAPVPPQPEQVEGFGPGATPVIAPTTSTAQRPTKWLTGGAMLGMQDGGGSGLRIELDLKAWNRWSLGIGASWSESNTPLYDGYMTSEDTKAVAYLVRTSQMGRWHFRASFGLGLVHTSANAFVYSGPNGYGDYDASGAFPTAEATVSIARELGRSWAVSAGPVASLYGQSYEMSPDTYGMSTTLERRDVDLMMYIGLRHRL